MTAVAAGTLLLGTFRTSVQETSLDWVEGTNLVSAERLAEGGLEALYPPLPTPAHPIFINPYTPVFFLEWTAVRDLLGLPGSFLPGRAVALLSLVVCTGILWAALARTVTARWTAFAFALVLLTSRFAVDHAAIATADVPALAWAATGVYLVGRQRAAGRPAWPALFLFSAAILTKQSMLAGLAAGTTFLLLDRRSRDAAVLLGGTAALLLGVAMVANELTNGGFLAATFWVLRHPIEGSLTRLFLGEWLKSPLTLTCLILAGLAVPLAWRSAGWVRLAVLYAFFGLAVALATSGKVGAAPYYYLEATLACCWAAGAGFERLTREAPRLLATAVALALALFALAAVDNLWRGKQHVTRETENVRTAVRELGDEDLRGWILSEPRYFQLIARHGGEVYANDFYTSGILLEQRRWPLEWFASDLACGRVAAVVTPIRLGTVGTTLKTEKGYAWEHWRPWTSPVLVPLILQSYALVPGPFERSVFVYRPRQTVRCG